MHEGVPESKQRSYLLFKSMFPLLSMFGGLGPRLPVSRHNAVCPDVSWGLLGATGLEAAGRSAEVSRGL